MSKRFFVDEATTSEGKYRVLQEDSETKERFGVKDFDTREEAQSNAETMQKAADRVLSEEDTLINFKPDSSADRMFKNTLQDLKDETSQD